MRPGVVDVRDLPYRYETKPAIMQFVAAARLDVAPEPAWRAFAPPHVVVVIVPFDDPRVLRRLRPWLAAAGHRVIVRDGTGVGEAPSSPERRRAVEPEWRDVLAVMPPADVFDWIRAGNGAAPRVAIAAALAQADTAMPAQRVVRASPDLQFPATAWAEWRCERASDLPRVIASQIAVRDGRVVLLGRGGATIDLATLSAPITIDVDEDTMHGVATRMLEIGRRTFKNASVAAE